MIATIDCLLTHGNHALQAGRLDEAAETIPQIMDWVHRAVNCGALVDPWNILGFAGNFSRFHGPDSAVHDHRVGDLVALMEQIFALLSRIWRESAGAGRDDLGEQAKRKFREHAQWWRQFAAHEVSDVNATDPQETFKSAKLVAEALGLWHKGGASTGDKGFWKPHAELFDSPKAYALVVESLLDRHDFVAAMALLIHWLGQADRVGLQSGGASFSDLARQWLQRLESTLAEEENQSSAGTKVDWSLAQKFIDQLESNAGSFLQPPKFMLTSGKFKPRREADLVGGQGDFEQSDADEETAGGDLGAAYDGVVYEDSTDDGNESETAEEGSDNQDELQLECNRLGQHLTFLTALAQIWKTAALSPHVRKQIEQGGQAAERCSEALEMWSSQAATNLAGLLELLEEVNSYAISKAGADTDAMSRYDRQRLLKESLLERIISTAVETSDSRRMLLAALHSSGVASNDALNSISSLSEDDRLLWRFLLLAEG